MAELELRTPTRADAPEIAAICNEASQALHGEADLEAGTVEDWFELADLGMFLADRDGAMAGYADVRRDDDGRQFPIDVRIRPSAESAGPVLLRAAEEWARERAAPDAVLRAFANEHDAALQTLFAGAGYRVIRHSFQMRIELPETIDPPEWPDGISVRTFEDRDEKAVYEANQESFEDHWDHHRVPIEDWRVFMKGASIFDPSLWWLAEDGDEIAGICLNSWHFSGDHTFGWVGVLGVRRPWRRQGLGLALLRHSFADFKERGAMKVGLGVDGENTTGAVRLYERAGMRPARRNDTFEKPV
jgi:mycothiol synthase